MNVCMCFNARLHRFDYILRSFELKKAFATNSQLVKNGVVGIANKVALLASIIITLKNGRHTHLNQLTTITDCVRRVQT